MRLRTISFAEISLLTFPTSRPVGRVHAAPDISMKRGVWPVGHSRYVTMLDGIVMNVIDVALKIRIITYQMLPKSALPNCSFTPFLPRSRQWRRTTSVRALPCHALFDQRPAQ